MSFIKKHRAVLLCVLVICMMTANVYAADSIDVTAAVSSSLDGIVTQVMAIIGLAITAVMAIVGTKMAIQKGIGILQSLMAKT